MEVFRKVTAVNGRVSYMPATAADSLIAAQEADSALAPAERIGVYGRQDIANIDSADYYETLGRRNGQEIPVYTTEAPAAVKGAKAEIGEVGIDPDSVPRKSRHQANAPGLPDLSVDPLRTYTAQGHHVSTAAGIQGGTNFRSLAEAEAANSGGRSAAPATDNANGAKTAGTGKPNVGTKKPAASTGKKPAAKPTAKESTPATPAADGTQAGEGENKGDAPQS